MKISHLDHLVLTVADIPITVNFYEKVLGMKVVSFGAGRIALEFGHQKINLLNNKPLHSGNLRPSLLKLW